MDVRPDLNNERPWFDFNQKSKFLILSKSLRSNLWAISSRLEEKPTNPKIKYVINYINDKYGLPKELTSGNFVFAISQTTSKIQNSYPLPPKIFPWILSFHIWKIQASQLIDLLDQNNLEPPFMAPWLADDGFWSLPSVAMQNAMK